MKTTHNATVLALSLMALSACGGNGGSETSDDRPAVAATSDSETVAVAAPIDGAKAFAQCQACHTIDPGGASGVGPNLHGIVGKQAAASAGFSYSAALRDSGLVWDAGTLDAYLANPRKLVPGTTMSFAGIRDEEKRAALIEYLADQS